MKICIPTEDDNGLDSRLYGHFGSAPYFALADTESGFVYIKANGGRQHPHGQCAPIEYVDVGRTDAVVCLGMGKRALASLESGGVAVLVTSEDTVRGVIAEAREGKLRNLTTEEACGGHGHSHRH
jgi:predicted Fe-Mo cluster-binding NifX family protein